MTSKSNSDKTRKQNKTKKIQKKTKNKKQKKSKVVFQMIADEVSLHLRFCDSWDSFNIYIKFSKAFKYTQKL